MKTLKLVSSVLMAAGLMYVLASCCCLYRKPACVQLIRDGSFEDHSCYPTSQSYCSYSNSDGLNRPRFTSIANAGVWNIGSGTVVGLIPNNGPGQSPEDPASLGPKEFYNTPAGTHFIALGVGFSDVNYVATTLSQTINTPLQAGRTYRLSFLQAADTCGVQGYEAIPGKVQVELLGPGALPPLLFEVPANSAWARQSKDILINTTGTYTISFHSFGADPITHKPDSVANIDDVSLCEKH